MWFRAFFIVIAICGYCDDTRGQFEQSGAQPGGGTPPAGRNDGPALSFEASETYRAVEQVGENQYSLRTYAAPNPTNGPQETFVYKNAAGTFKIPDMTSVNGGRATYRWHDGSSHDDVLTYLAHGYVTEREGHLLAPGTKVSVWAYRAQDSRGNHFFIYFGTDAIINAPQGRRYPLYYSYGAPGPAPTFRWLTATGTTRD